MPYLKRGQGNSRYEKGGLAEARAEALKKQAERAPSIRREASSVSSDDAAGAWGMASLCASSADVSGTGSTKPARAPKAAASYDPFAAASVAVPEPFADPDLAEFEALEESLRG